MKVIHSDADSIHLTNAEYSAALTDLAGVPVLAVCHRGPARISATVWSGTLAQARAIAPQHNHAGMVRALMALYVDSGQLDAYRASHGQTDSQALAAR